MAPSSINLADALIYEISYLVAVERIFAKVFSPTPLVGLEIDLSNADRDAALEFVCQSGTNELMMYQIY